MFDYPMILFTKANFSGSKANRNAVHFPSYWILAFSNTLN